MILDIETNGLLDNCTVVHCAVLRDPKNRTVKTFGPSDIPNLIACLKETKLLVGHNLIDFDLKVLKKLYGFTFEGTVIDTLILCRLLWPDLREKDFGLSNKGKLPTNLIGRHSLEAWGFRLGYHKGDFSKTTDWQHYSAEMLEYCVRDTAVTAKLYELIVENGPSEKAAYIETTFAMAVSDMMANGIGFDLVAAEKLMVVLMQERGQIDARLVAAFPPFADKYVTPKRRVEKTKMTAFNPQSRNHIARALREKYGWTPKIYTQTGEVQLDESIISELTYPECPDISRRLLLQKRLGQLSEGAQNWIASVNPKTGRIHGYCNHNGAVTGRCTHSHPNMAQVPKDPEYRSLFIPSPGNVLVGCDASGLELRCFAHYLAKYDNGEYAREVLTGDIHTKNQKAAGLATRSQAKTFIYGLLYGAGDAKIGVIVGGSERDGKELRSRFMHAIPAYADLIKDIKGTIKKRKYLLGVDGRKLAIRHEHAALNTLLQSAGAIIMKLATVKAVDSCKGYGRLVAHVHDEMQFETAPERASALGESAAKSITLAGEELGFRCPLAGEWRSGSNWSETH